MLNVTIQNDGKIKIQSECSNTKEMRHNVNLLLAVVSSMETEEAAAKKEANGVPAQTTYYLYLDKVKDSNKLSTTKSLAEHLNIPLKNAKAIVDTVTDGRSDVLLDQSLDFDSINNLKDILETVNGCTCRITSGF